MRSLYPWPTFPKDLEPPTARSLSLLFILQEWLSSFQWLEQCEQKYCTPCSAPPEKEPLLQMLERLLLFSLELPFQQKGGFLDKLCFYCEILLKASQLAGESIPMILEEMRSCILSFKAGMSPVGKRPCTCEALHMQAQNLFRTLGEQFRSLFSALVPFLKEARTDENVLIYLLEKKGRFNHYLGRRSIEELLQRFFPAGLSHLRAVICEGLTRRGFTSFLAEKESLIEELEWENQTS